MLQIVRSLCTITEAHLWLNQPVATGGRSRSALGTPPSSLLVIVMVQPLRRRLTCAAARLMAPGSGLTAALISLAVVMPPVSQANPTASAGQPSRQQMMEAMQGMQACMARVDRAALERLHQQAERTQGQIRSLCRAGNEAGAQAQAMALAGQMAADPNLKTMQACLAQLPQVPMVQAMLPMSKLGVDDPSDADQPRSICERLR